MESHKIVRLFGVSSYPRRFAVSKILNICSHSMTGACNLKYLLTQIIRQNGGHQLTNEDTLNCFPFSSMQLSTVTWQCTYVGPNKAHFKNTVFARLQAVVY
jgi:hypothetical protein